MNRPLVFNGCALFLGIIILFTPIWGVAIIMIPLNLLLILGEVSSKVSYFLDWPHLTDEELERIHRRRH